MAAGQLGGPLHPTHNMTNAATNASFGAAMQAWNEHRYTEAVELFRAHMAHYPDSPWAAEAVLHIGCDALYHGRYTEAQGAFQGIIQGNANNGHPGAQMLVHKARLRLANLKTLQGNFPEAMGQLAILKQSSPDWRHRTYAAHWIQRLSREKHEQAAIFNCGTQALAFLLEKRGKKAAAAKVLALKASSPRGQSMKELQRVAAEYGYRLTGLRLTVSQLKKLPLPAIMQLSGVHQGDLGHYWVLEKTGKDALNFYDPQSRSRFTQTTAEFAKEWGGHALVFARRQKLPGAVLAAREMENLYGGCCGAPRPANDLGAPESPPGDPDCKPNPGDDPCRPKPGCGSPAWSVNKINLNFFVRDIPLWYHSPIGPPVEIALSYNSQSAIATYEPFGHKWQFNYATYLVEDSGGQVTVFMPDGRRDVYTPDGLGGYTSPTRVYNTLVKTGASHYELWFPEDTVYVYDIPPGSGSQQPFLVEMRDARGLRLTFGYNAQVQLTTITDALGRPTTLTYNSAGLVTAATDPFGRQAAFEYDANGNLTKITDMGGYWSTFTYDQDIYLTSIGNARGTWTFYTEPADGINPGPVPYSIFYPPPGTMDPTRKMWENYRITITNPLSLKEEYFFAGGAGQWSWHVSPMDYVEYVDPNTNNDISAKKTTYNNTIVANKGTFRNVVRPTATLASVWFDYDSVGNCTKIQDYWGTSYYAYNSRGKLTSVTNPNNKITTMAYAANNVDLISIINDLGEVSLTYNHTHDITSITDRLGHTTNFTYNAYGQVTSVQDALDIVNQYLYDDGHRLTAITRDGQTLQQYTYDGLDRVRTQTDATGLTLTYDYNELDQVTRITYPDTRFKSYQYSTCCPFKLDSVTERSEQTTFYSYDPLNRLTAVTNPGGGVTGFGYDANGNRTSIVDAKLNTTGFTYDSGNRLTKKTYADGTFETYLKDYGGFDLPINRIDARGIKTDYWYTPLKMLKGAGLIHPGYTYDGHGRLINACETVTYFYYAYDTNSRLLSVDSPWADDKITYQYDALGRKTDLTWENGKGQPVAYKYDTLNRLTSVNVGGQVYTYGYAGASPLVKSLTRPNGAVTTYDYDLLNRLAQTTTRVGETVIDSYSYTYNDQDLRDTETAAAPGTPTPYAGELVNYEYNNVNALLRITDPGEKTLTYDAAGNLTRGYTPEGYAFTAVYDGSNRLTSLSYAGSDGKVNKTDFIYLGNLLFQKKQYQNNGLVKDSRFIYDGYLLLQERDQYNNVVNEYTWGQGLPGGIGGLLDLYQGAVHYSYLYDGKGNVTALLDENANVAATYQYDPFGVPRIPANSINQPMQFSTKPYDEKTGLSYYGYRFYVPALGRWLTRDPIGEEGGINLYGFVGNNPINYIDPNGLKAVIPNPFPPGCPPGPSCDPYLKCGEYYLYILCRTFPNDPLANCIRGCLLKRWNNCKYDNGLAEDHKYCYLYCLGLGG
ncbi:MAG: RHS repeat-associated core domain-containing protein [Thermodesulfobacteriota bacterium]